MRNKELRLVLPYAVILLCFVIYMQYWAKIIPPCLEHLCERGYDDAVYHHRFLGLLDGSWPGNQPFSSSPFAPFYLWVIQAIFHFPVNNLAIPYLTQIFLATLTCAITYKIARDTFSQAVALITALLWGSYEFAKFFATTVEVAIPLTFFLTSALYFSIKYNCRQNKFFLAMAAICLGIAIIGRQNNLAIVGAIVLWLIFLKCPLIKLTIAVLILGFIIFLTLLPALIHNSLVKGELVLAVSTYGVINFTMGNLPGAPGTYWKQASPSIEPSIRFITEQPMDWFILMLRKLQLFFTFPWSPAPFKALPLVYSIPWLLCVILCLFYFVKTFLPQRSLLHFSLLFYSASIIINHVEDEFRIPILPVLFIFVAVTFLSLSTQFYKTALKIYSKVQQLQLQVPATILTWSSLVICLFTLYIPSPQVSYKVDSIESEAVHSGVIAGQKFQIECPKFYQIQVKMRSLNPAGSVAFHLREGSLEGPEMYNQVIDTAQLNNFDYHAITFPEIADSAGKQYVFYFDTTSLKSAEEGIIFAGGRAPFAESLNRIDPVKRIAGGAFVNLGSLDGNLAFTAYCQASPIELIETAVNQLAHHISSSPVFKPILLGIIVAHALALPGSILFIFIRTKKSRRRIPAL